MKNKLIFTLMIICMVTIFPLCITADTYPAFTDTSGVSDAEFFGGWTKIYGTYGYWSTDPQLNYTDNSGLSAVEAAAKAGNYTLAKEELLTYYKNRTGITYPSSPHTAANANTIFWAMNDSFAYKDKYITDIDITSTSATDYTINLGKNTYSGRFMLSSVQKSTDMIAISSREGSSPAKLVITKTNGDVITLNPIKDTYIRAGSYSANNYGSDSYLYVKDDYTLSSGTYLPYSDNSRRSYVFFDNDDIPSSGISSVKLVINARLVGEGNTSASTDSSINLVVIDPHNQSWGETSDDSTLTPMTWSNYVIDHFSWKGLPGGVVWEKPKNSQAEFFNSNTRFTQIASLVSKSIAVSDASQKKEYMYKAMELVLDFIGETTDSISVGVPENRDIESANRCHEFTALYKFFLDSEFMNADANTAMLKWLYKEILYLYNGAGVLFNGATSDVKSNNFAYTNRGAWHCAGFLASLAYFPEFSGTDDWETVLNERLKLNVDYLIADDGCYLESTFGYSANVIKHYNAMMATWENTNKEPLANLDDKLQRLARYLMYVGYPDGEAPKWGDNAGSSRSMIKQIDTYADDPEVLYYASAGKSGTVPSQNSIQLDSLKIVTSRTGWSEDDSVLFINATNGGNHGHKDSLALTLYHDGKEILEDTGLSSYDQSTPSFAWQRNTTRSHNTIEIDETAQRGTASLTANGDSSIALKANDKADIITSYTDATEGFRHNRNLMWIKDLGVLVVNDLVEPSDTSSHKYTQNWHTHATYSSNPTIDATTFNGATNYASGTQLIVAQADKDNMTAQLLSGYSARTSKQTKYFSYEKNVSGDARFSTALVPVSEGDSVSVNATTLSVTGTGDTQAMKTVLTRDGIVSNIMSFTSFNSDGTSHTFGDYTTDASDAYCVTDANGNITAGGVFGGNTITQGDNIILSAETGIGNVTFSIDDGTLNIVCPEGSSDTCFVIGSLADVHSAAINGKTVDVAKINGTYYVNFGTSVELENGGPVGNSNFLWSYDSKNKALSIYGKGDFAVYTASDYTSRPWQSVAQEVKHIVFSKGIFAANEYTFLDMSAISDVWCSDEFFTVSDNTYTINNKFAGDVEYICSSAAAICGTDEFLWEYTPDFATNMGSLTISSSSGNGVLSEPTSCSWKHLNYSTLTIDGASTISADMSNSNLKSLTISGATTIGASAFAECYNLSEVKLSEGTQYINSRAFALSQSGGPVLNINMPLSLVEIASDAFDGRGTNNLKLNGYPDSVAESFATENGHTFSYITSGESNGEYNWKYDESNQYLYIDINGAIPSNFADAYPDAESTYEPYISKVQTLHIGRNVTSVASGVFNAGNITVVYCPYALFDLTYTQQNTTDADVLYTDSNGDSQVYPAYITVSGQIIPTHNAKIATSMSNKFAGSVTYKPASGIFVAYSKTDSPDTIAPKASFDWDYNPITGEMVVDCLSGEEIGNSSIRDRSYYPWSDISSEVSSIKFTGNNIRTIGKYAFANFGIKKLKLPTSVKAINMRAFYNCTKLEGVNLHEGLEYITSYAFRNCTSLKSILIPESVTTIATNTFYNTDALIICYAGTKAASTDFAINSSELNEKRILSKLSYADGNISILCGSDETNKLVIAYYKYNESNVPQLVNVVGEDVTLVKDTTLTISDNLSDYECDYVDIMLISSSDTMHPNSKVVKVTK